MGSGLPLVVVHGGPGLGHEYLLESFSSLRDSIHLIFYDQRATGRSGHNLDSTQVRLQNFVDDIDALRSHYGYDKISILAHSFGGLLAVKYALDYPEELERLILLNALAPVASVNADANTKLANRFSASDIELRTTLIRSKEFQNGDPLAFEKLMKIGFRYQFHDSAFIDSLQLNLPADFAVKSAVLQGLGPDLVNYDWSASLDTIHSKVLLMYGAADPLTALAMPIYADNLPFSQSVILDQSGHFPFLEQQVLTLKHIRRFLLSP